MATASVGFHCPECLKGAKQQVLSRSNNFGERSYMPIVTGLMVINALIFVYGMVIGAAESRIFEIDFMLNAALVDRDGSWWRVITSGFLHANLIHVGFNMYLLYAIGQQLEKRYGWMTFSGLYLAGLLGGSLGVFLIEPTSSAVGASGAVFALMGFLMVIQFKNGINVMQSGIGRLVAINIMFSFLPGISMGGHFGGLLTGCLAALIVTDVLPKVRPDASKTTVGLAMFAFAAVLAAVLVPAVTRAAGMF